MPELKLGVTATRNGLTPEQLSALERSIPLLFLPDPTVIILHHGDCLGGDAQVHEFFAAHYGKRTHLSIHPPIDNKLRAYSDRSEHRFAQMQVRLPKPYLVRNKDIVAESETLLAFPAEMMEQERSGTWATVRYARQANLRIWLFYPSGFVHTSSQRQT